MLNLTRLNCLLTMGGVKYHPSMRSVLLSGYLAAAHADNDRNIALPYIFNGSVATVKSLFNGEIKIAIGVWFVS